MRDSKKGDASKNDIASSNTSNHLVKKPYTEPTLTIITPSEIKGGVSNLAESNSGALS